jgi:hypothetical protein
MEKETVDLFLQALEQLTQHSQLYWRKFTALDRMLESRPEMRAEYEHHLREIIQSEATKKAVSESAKILAELRAKLLLE